MIDSIIFFGAGSKAGNRLTALADLRGDQAAAEFVFDREGGGHDFDPSRIIPVELVTQRETFDADGNVVTPRQTLAGFGILVATRRRAAADALWALPDNICRVQLNRETGKILRRRVPLATLRGLIIEPMFAGSNYAFSSIDEE